MPKPTWVTLLILDDPHDAGLAKAALETEGVPVAVPGLAHRSLMPGIDGAFIRLPVQVPEERLDDAVDVLTATGFLDEEGRPTNRPPPPPEPGQPPEPTRPGDREQESPQERPTVLLLIASGVGLAQLAAGRRGVGMLLGAAFGALVVLGLLVCTPTLLLYPLIPIVDLRGALAWRRRARGGPTEEGGLPVGAPLVLALVLTPTLLMWQAPSVFIGGAGRELCALSDRCDIEPEAECVAGLAAQIGDGGATWGHIRECSDCLSGDECIAARWRCDRACTGVLLDAGWSGGGW